MRRRVALWKQVFDTDDHAIVKAINRLAWDLAAFSCIVEMVRRAPVDEDGRKRLNGLMLDMLASGFWSNTMQGIRRLADEADLHGRRGVCSLAALIADAKQVRHRLTRRVFVEDIAGLPYNYESIRRRYWEWSENRREDDFWVPRDLYYEPSEERHAEFDWLSGTTPQTSTPDDVIREEVFTLLEERLKRLDRVVEHVNVRIAHAATEASRQGRVLEQWNLDDAKAAVKELTQLATLAGQWFCFLPVGQVLPTPQYDQFAHLTEPLLVGDADRLRDVWDAFESESAQWSDFDYRALANVVGG